MLKPLDRRGQDYLQLTIAWLQVPTLDMFQRSMVRELQKAAGSGVEAFDQKREFILKTFPKQLWDAINKARHFGVGRDWKQYA